MNLLIEFITNFKKIYKLLAIFVLLHIYKTYNLITTIHYFMSIRLARIISYLFHPVLVPTFLFAVLFFLTPCFMVWTNTIKYYLLGFIFLGTFAFPITITLFLLRYNRIASIEMLEQEDRRKPFLLTTLFYASVAFLLSNGIFQGTLLSFIMISIATTVCLATIINFFHKISMHSVGISGSLGTLFALQYYDSRYDLLIPILVFILLTGFIGSARLTLAAHTPLEVLTGCLLGFFSSLGLILMTI